MKPKSERNDYGVKSSSDCYRNINGIHFECYTSNSDDFDRIKKEAKELGLKVRLINGELYREVKL